MEHLLKFMRLNEITFTQLVVLCYVSKHEGCSIIDISRKLAISRASIHKHLFDLRRMRFISTLRFKKDDRRYCDVWLSAEGHAFMVKCNKILAKIGTEAAQ